MGYQSVRSDKRKWREWSGWEGQNDPINMVVGKRGNMFGTAKLDGGSARAQKA